MKKNMFVILVGVAVLHIAVFGGLFVSGGCSNVVMDRRSYIAPSDTAETPMSDFVAPATTPAQPTVSEVPAAPPKAATRPVPKTYEPMSGVSSSGGVDSSAATTPGGTYTVKAGDTVGKIANAHGVSVAAMLKANNLDLKSARRIRIGQKLIVPAGGQAVKSESIQAAKKATGSTRRTTTSSSAQLNPDGTYTVKAGDTIPHIARRLGLKASELQKANNLTDEATRRLQIGQKLVVPGKSSAATAAMTTPATAKPAETPVATPVAQSEIDNLLNQAESTPVAPQQSPAASETSTPAALSTTPTVNADTTAFAGNSIPVEVEDETITIEEFCRKQNISVESLKALNSDLPKDNILKKETVVFIPAN